MENSLKQESRPMKVTGYTRRVCRQQLIAKGILWASAGITIAILLVIIGYIVIRGFVADIRKEYPVISQGKNEVGLDPEGEHRIVFVAPIAGFTRNPINIELIKRKCAGETAIGYHIRKSC